MQSDHESQGLDRRRHQRRWLASLSPIRDAECMIELADSHIHLDDDRYEADREALIHAAWSAGIRRQILPATRRRDWSRIAALSRRHPQISAAYGLHPLFLSDHQPADLAALRTWLLTQPGPAVAIGEIGLDFHSPQADRDLQQWYFQQQLTLAQSLQLPVIIHVRKALDEVIAQLRRRPGLRGVIHAFAGSPQQADQLLQLGFYLGVGGTVTYPRAQRLRRIVQSMPADRLLLETDAPDQPLAGFQGQRNLPIRLLDVLHCVADLRRTTAQELAARTLDNTCTLFKLPQAPLTAR